MSIIRAYQRALTAASPHQANKRFLVPNRKLGGEPVPPVRTRQLRFSDVTATYINNFADDQPETPHEFTFVYTINRESATVYAVWQTENNRYGDEYNNVNWRTFRRGNNVNTPTSVPVGTDTTISSHWLDNEDTTGTNTYIVDGGTPVPVFIDTLTGTGTGELTIGARATHSNPFPGIIKDVKIYDSNLNLTHWWPIDQVDEAAWIADPASQSIRDIGPGSNGDGPLPGKLTIGGGAWEDV
ncbi:MAG: LamG domain-containing protein [Fuerstiella sp.]|nr:LamG domain-containing protein [Fuerstiella sp.]